VASGSRFGSRSQEKLIEPRGSAKARLSKPIASVRRIDQANSGGAIQHTERAGDCQPKVISGFSSAPRFIQKYQVCFHTDGETNGFPFRPDPRRPGWDRSPKVHSRLRASLRCDANISRIRAGRAQGFEFFLYGYGYGNDYSSEEVGQKPFESTKREIVDWRRVRHDRHSESARSIACLSRSRSDSSYGRHACFSFRNASVSQKFRPSSRPTWPCVRLACDSPLALSLRARGGACPSTTLEAAARYLPEGR
jgi:hypothetical protein